ncbi:MAG: hypothetical protein V7635_582, partial [Arthrobacter sp.]
AVPEHGLADAAGTDRERQPPESTTYKSS